MTTNTNTNSAPFRIDACEEAFVRDFCPYKGNPDPLVVWRAAWESALSIAAQPPAGWVPGHPITEEMHVAACKVLRRANGLDGLPQRMLDALIAAAPKAEPVQPTVRRNTKTHELLSSLIGIVLGARTKIGYTDNSPIAKEVADAVEHLKDWPYPAEPVQKPERVPLTEAQKQTINPYHHAKGQKTIWLAGFAAAERAHGITTNMEQA